MYRRQYLVIIPTYNENRNIGRLISEVLEQDQRIDILVVDDNSPDGTAEIVKKMMKRGKPAKRLNLIERSGKLGLGTAYRDGFIWGLKKNYDYFISMDADFSHSPAALDEMIELSQKHPSMIILGSRYVKGGKIKNWDFKRYFNSHIANWATRLLLGTRAKDSTAGFKCYPKEFIKKINLKSLVASGYAFQVEMLFLAKEKGYLIKEFPITFMDRKDGVSKVGGELKRSSIIVLKLALRRRIVRQFIKFGLVGFICSLIDWAVFFGIKFLTGWQLQYLKQITKGISFTFSATFSYILNRTWTFRSTEQAVAKQASLFFVVATIGLGLNNLIFYLITGIFGWPDIAGLVIATLIVMFWNFSANKLLVFKNT